MIFDKHWRGFIVILRYFVEIALIDYQIFMFFEPRQKCMCMIYGRIVQNIALTSPVSGI